MPLQNLLVSEAHQRLMRSGNPDVIPMPVGQIVGRMNEVRPVADVISSLVAELERDRWRGWSDLRLSACRLVAGHAVDQLAQQVGVPVVPRVLLDHVQVDPPQVDHVTGPRGWLNVSSSDRPGGRLVGRRALGREGREVLLCVALPSVRSKSPSGCSSLQYSSPRSACPANRIRNQVRSTSAMCRTRPSSESVEDCTGRL